MKKLPKKIKIGLRVFGMCAGLIVALNSVSAVLKNNLPTSTVSDTFPESYQIYIDKLKEKYPNAIFKAVYTGLNWNTVLKHESYEVNKRISTIPSSYEAGWKMDGKNTYIDGYFVVASKSGVAYVLDPRNSLYEREIFQFEGLKYNEAITTQVIEKVMVGSPLVGTYAKKYKNAGKWIDMDMSYSEIVNKVGKELDVSSVYIASRMIQETSGDIVNNGSINGSNTTYPGIYNFFNIGATPNSDGSGAVLNGLKYAKAEGWTTPYLSIYGGVDEIKSSYIKYGQDTVYFQKFDVNNPYGNAVALMAYQYQTNIMAPRSESRISYSAYKKLDMLDTAFTFYIPVYNNMPQDPTPYPAGDNAIFVEDNTKVYLDDEIVNGKDIFNIRSSASSELDNIIYTLEESEEGADNRKIITRTKKGDGYDWDYVEIDVDGKTIKGYVWKDYVKEYVYTKVESVLLDKTELVLELEETCKLELTITPDNAKYKEVIWSSSNEEVVSVNDGTLTANAVGIAEITVKSVDGSKEAKCKVEVIEKVKDIILDKEEYTVEVGLLLKPNLTLKNIENIELKIEDETIACIEDEQIKGLKVGETILQITGVGTDVVKTVKIIVTEKVAEEYILDESLVLDESKSVTNVLPDTLISSLKQNITLTNLELKVINHKGEVLQDTDTVGTDTKLVFLRKDGTEYDLLTVVIRGEVTGDGKINSGDLFKTVRYLKGNDTINAKAADVTLDGNINSGDLFKMVRYLKGNDTIDFK